MLREERKNKTQLGLKAESFMNAGGLVPDELMFEIIGKTLSKPECTKVMFDGFPRTLDQAKKVFTTNKLYLARCDAQRKRKANSRSHLFGHS